MEEFLLKTAWRMTQPAPYSHFHLLLTVLGVSTAVFSAWKLRNCRQQTSLRILFGCGVFLGSIEGYKQLFLYYIVNHQTYDWWYFPFQLCSIPMYVCLLLPWIKSLRIRRVICTFMQDFHLLGGIMALLEPSGFLHPYWFLTLHGFVWHFTLIFISLLIGFHNLSDLSIKGYLKTLPLFGTCCLIASFINVAAHTQGDANMFYISPYYPSSQVVFHQFALKYGIMAGNLAYLFSICLGSFLCHMGIRLVVSRLRKFGHETFFKS